jgi:hypothetical protein
LVNVAEEWGFWKHDFTRKQQLIQDRFPSQRAFCRASGIGEDMLSHVLAGRKDLSLDTLTLGLKRIGYQLLIVRAVQRKPGRRPQQRTG